MPLGIVPILRPIESSCLPTIVSLVFFIVVLSAFNTYSQYSIGLPQYGQVSGTTTGCGKAGCFFALRDFAKPFALAEEVMLGAIPTDFLTEDLRRSADDLTGYLGAFTAVELPPAACDKQGAALLYPRADGFTAKFLSVQTEGGLISNLSLD